jgi:undecaprenyl-diphosphatase
MFDSLEKIDQQSLLFGNSLHNAFFDAIVPQLTSFWVWIPLFIWWLVEVYKLYGRKIYIIILFVIGLLIASDQSSVLVKNSVKRYRPTHNIELKDKIHLVDAYRGGQYGYVSSHATNSFAISFFLFLLLKASPKKWLKASLFIWATILCYTRIYLGVHYPFDLFSGALLGTLLAFVFYRIFVKFNT